MIAIYGPIFISGRAQYRQLVYQQLGASALGKGVAWRQFSAKLGVDGAWRPVIAGWIGVDGAWRPLQWDAGGYSTLWDSAIWGASTWQ